MKDKKLTASEKKMRVHQQRFAMIILLCNVLDSEQGVSNGIKSAISASLLNIMDTSMIPVEDEALINLINNSIDAFCKEVEETSGIEDYRSQLLESVQMAREVIDALSKKIERIKEGEDILKNISLN
jgi:hypothetical protein